MTDSSNITENDQQNGKEKLHANPSVFLHQSLCRAKKNTNYFLSSLKLRALSGSVAVSYPHSYKNYSFSTLSQKLLVSKCIDKNVSTRVILCLGCVSLKHTFYLLCSGFLQKLHTACASCWIVYICTLLH